MYVCVCVLYIYPIFSAKQEDVLLGDRTSYSYFFLIDVPLIRNKNGVYLRTKRVKVYFRTPVVFYRIFIPCAILFTESSKQRLTFFLDRQFFASLRFGLVFMICPKKLVRFRIRLTSFFLLLK